MPCLPYLTLDMEVLLKWRDACRQNFRKFLSISNRLGTTISTMTRSHPKSIDIRCTLYIDRQRDYYLFEDAQARLRQCYLCLIERPTVSFTREQACRAPNQAPASVTKSVEHTRRTCSHSHAVYAHESTILKARPATIRLLIGRWCTPC